MWNPRMGGEKLYKGFLLLPGPGSPPRRRGKDGLVDDMSNYEGITPA